MAHFRKQQITIFVTSKCNLNCGYCYAKNDHKDDVIDIDFCKYGIKEFFETTSSRWVRFFGAGEPTMRMDAIKELTEYARSKGALRLELQTNGAFDADTAKWVAENMTDVWFSIDGPRHIHNAQRAAYDEVATNITTMRLLNRKLFIGARPTITYLNVERQIEILTHFKEAFGINAVYADPVCDKIGEEENGWSVSPMRFAKEFIKAWRWAETHNVLYGTMMTVNFDEPCHIACRACIPNPHLTTDGYVSACDMCVSRESNIAPDLLYGKWNGTHIEYWNEPMRLIQKRNVQGMSQCQKCEILHYCAGGCLGEGYNETGNLFGLRPDICDAKQYLAREMGTNKGLERIFHP